MILLSVGYNLHQIHPANGATNVFFVCFINLTEHRAIKFTYFLMIDNCRVRVGSVGFYSLSFFDRHKIHMAYRTSHTLFEIEFFAFAFHGAKINAAWRDFVFRFYECFIRVFGILEGVVAYCF